jgi:hypothetical protein
VPQVGWWAWREGREVAVLSFCSGSCSSHDTSRAHLAVLVNPSGCVFVPCPCACLLPTHPPTELYPLFTPPLPRYYLRNLTDEVRFRDWPVVEHLPLLQVSGDGWVGRAGKKGCKCVVSQLYGGSCSLTRETAVLLGQQVSLLGVIVPVCSTSTFLGLHAPLILGCIAFV